LIFLRVLSCFVIVSGLFPVSLEAQSRKPHVLMISIDGMKPEYITHADEHGLKVPNLRLFLSQGSYADGVVGVVPTVTFPSHITLITGVWPAEHGVVANALFDPLGELQGESYWYFRQLHAETLYQAADAAGLTTASVGWPVTLGAPVDYLIAGYGEPAKSAAPEDQPLHPLDIKQQLNLQFVAGTDDDDHRAGWAEGIIRKWNPNFVLLHFNDLDKNQHAHSPFSPEADAAMEHLDRLAGEAIAAELAMNPDAVIVVVSDHGFARVDHEVNLNAFFVQAGLIALKPVGTVGASGNIASWDAECRLEDGSAAVVLRDPQDNVLLAKVKGVLDAMKADPANGIDRVLDAKELHRRGGFSDASFLIDLKPGWSTRGGFRAPFVVDTPGIGTHGYLPDHVEMRSSFFVKGPGVAEGEDLGVIDMRQITPTVAKMLHVQMPAAKMKPVDYEAK
jgi:predicted AlkP superfamily pyrophosphatase or phosphodiesterase